MKALRQSGGLDCWDFLFAIFTMVLPGYVEEAIARHLKAIELSPGSDDFLGWLGLSLGLCGRKAEARGVLEQLRQSKGYSLSTAFAHVHLGLSTLFSSGSIERSKNATRS